MVFSKSMDKLLVALANGEDVKTIDDKPVRKNTIAALTRRGTVETRNGKLFLTDSGRARADAVVMKENIEDHRPNRLQFRWFDRHFVATFDIGQCDYLWWDRARRGAVRGLELAGLFLKPLASKKAAWVLGQAPQFKFEDEDTAQKVNEWFQEHHNEILQAMEEAANLGDYYIVINPDESISILTPDVVEPVVDESDYSKQIGWKITQSFAHPQNPMRIQTVIDEYYVDRRVRTVNGANSSGKPKTFPNLTGLLPVIHVANNLHGGEMFGHPEGEPLVRGLHHYGEVLDIAIEGNVRQGRPTPVFEKLGSADNLAAFWTAFGDSETNRLPDGSTEEVPTIRFTSDQAIYLGETGTFKYASPGSFTADTMNILQIFFYLFIQHTELPEFVWGGAIQGSRASVETQMPPFVKWTEKEQGRAEKWLIPLIVYITALKSLYDRDVKYSEDETPKVRWAPLTEGDGKLTLEAIKVALGPGKWKPEWVVPYMPLDIDNPEEIIQDIIKQAEEEAQARAEQEVPFVPSPAPDNMNNPDGQDQPAQDNAEIAQRVQKALSEAENSGVMVAFEIDLDTATTLVNAARQAGLDATAPEDLHITLAYMPERDEDTRDALETAMGDFTNNAGRIEGVVGGIGRFNGSEFTGGQDVIYASFDAAELPEFRQGLVEALEAAGVVVAKNHGFTPHITLAYVDKDTDMPPLFLETIPLKFESVTLYWGDERTRYELRGEQETERIVL